jgi:glycosyltransferase involved in cell wall biosynthesis
MTQRPRVSIVVPAFNAELTLAEAIGSIEAQHCADLEIVVVDDGSTDGTARVVEGLGAGLRYLRQENRGPSAARNVGLAATTGEIVAFLDADDIWPDRSLRVRLDSLASRPGCALVQGRFQNLWPHMNGPGQHKLDPPQFGYNLGTALFRRSLFDAIGGFDESMRTGEDVDFLVRIETGGLKRHRLDEVTLLYRRRLVDDINAHRRHVANLAGALKRALDAHRRKTD